MLQIHNLKIPIEINDQQTAERERLLVKAAKVLRISQSDIKELEIIKKSVDARQKTQIFLIYTVWLALNDKLESRILARNIKNISPVSQSAKEPARVLSKVFNCRGKNLPPVVVGSGPAGMFAALALAEAGLRPVVIERGQCVAKRAQDVEAFWQQGILDPESNVQFGEGGAGTFSDGKLTTGTNDPRSSYILNAFIEAGAPREIGYQAKPHIGTDHLRQVVERIRQRIIALGGEYRFGHKLCGLQIKDGKLEGLVIREGEQVYEMPVKHLVLAIGHSARDTFAMLNASGVPMQAKAFSIGVRIEHPQLLINQSQYGAWAGHPDLGAADYKLACHLPGGRSVYTFCMCPGGQVVAAASEAGGVVTNGMSFFSRAKQNANSAVLVSVWPTDFPSDHPLAGIEFQRTWERTAFQLGGGDYKAPAQCVGDFLLKQASKELSPWQSTYRPGVVPSDLDQCLPDFVTAAIREALPIFDQKLKGFAHPDSILTGVETRSSSPVRILRDDSCQSAIRGLYPCGEGAGYAGGIMSAAADGLRCAEAILSTCREDGCC